jgi:hypothetical protein
MTGSTWRAAGDSRTSVNPKEVTMTNVMNVAAINAADVAVAVRRARGTSCSVKVEARAQRWEAVAEACVACQAAVNRRAREAARAA